MLFLIVLSLATALQIAAAALALRLNFKFPGNSAWIFISTASVLMTVRVGAMLISVSRDPPDVLVNIQLWTESLVSLLVAILFVAGVALIEPLFFRLNAAKELVEQRNLRLEQVVSDTEDELKAARQVQRNMFPEQAPQLVGLDVAGATRPAAWTGGDYFDYLPLKGNRLLAAVADVSGHGLAPALLMAETRILLRSLAADGHEPAEILRRANRTIAADVRDGRFVTVFLALIDPASGELVYAGAGHDAYLLRRHGWKTLSAASLPLGVVADLPIAPAAPQRLEPGDMVLLPTDGILETEASQGDYFGIERTMDVARRWAGYPAETVVDEMLGAAEHFREYRPQHDDSTLVVVKFTGCGEYSENLDAIQARRASK